MSGTKRRCALSIAICGWALLPNVGTTRAQQAGVQESTSADSSSSYATANSTAANPARASRGASSWSAGQGSFGTNGKLPGATNGAVGTTGGAAAGNSGQSSWVAGRGSFGSTAQAGGIWRESSGFSEATGTGTNNRQANGTYVPAVSPSFIGLTPAFGNKSVGGRPAHAMSSHTLTSLHAGAGTHAGVSSGISKGSRSGISGRGSTRPGVAGLPSRSNTPHRNLANRGSATKFSGAGATTKHPSGFTPSGSPLDDVVPDMTTAPEAPPL